MIPLVAGIFGLFLGFFVSPNSIVAMICGAMFALLAWAMTGFKIENTSPLTPDDSNRIKAAVSATNSKFAIDDHGEITPEEFGIMFVRQSFATSEVLVEMLFAAGKPGENYPVRLVVISDPLAARLFLRRCLLLPTLSILSSI